MVVTSIPSQPLEKTKTTESTFEPMLKQWRNTPWLVREAFSVGTVYAVLVKVNQLVFMGSAATFTLIVGAPMLEEITFRGLLQPLVERCQAMRNSIEASYNDKPVSLIATPKRLQEQKIFRVALVGILFGAAHMINPHKLIERIVQSSQAAISGIGYCCLKEETGSIAPSIIGHAINNGIVALAMTGMIAVNTMLIVWLAFKVAQVFIAVNGLENSWNSLANLVH